MGQSRLVGARVETPLWKSEADKQNAALTHPSPARPRKSKNARLTRASHFTAVGEGRRNWSGAKQAACHSVVRHSSSLCWRIFPELKESGQKILTASLKRRRRVAATGLAVAQRQPSRPFGAGDRPKQLMQCRRSLRFRDSRGMSRSSWALLCFCRNSCETIH